MRNLVTDIAASTPSSQVGQGAPRRIQPQIRSLVWAATQRLRNRSVLIGAWLAGLLLVFSGHPWLAFGAGSGGIAAYGGLVLHDLFDPTLIRQVHGLRELPPQQCEVNEAALCHPLEHQVAIDVVEPEDHRELFREIVAAHEGIRIRLATASATVRAALLATYGRCTEMARVAEPLVSRGHELREYLALHSPMVLEGEARSLENCAEESSDAKARLTFRAAAKAKQGHLATYREVQGLCDRIKAQLAVIKASLQSVEARLVKLAACDADIEQSASATLDELSQLVCLDLGSLEYSVDAVSEPF